MPVHSRWLLAVVTVGLLAPLLAVPASASSDAYDDAIELSFPVPDLDARHFVNDYHDPRGNGRVHQATDIGDPNAYGLEVHAAVGGEVTMMTGVDNPVPSYGYMLRIAGDDGRTYSYIHLGDQDGPTEEAYASGLTRGDRVERGQHIGYVGHSGNASEAFPHLHLAIADPQVTDPYGDQQRNPYASLVAAVENGDVPGGPRFSDVPGGHTHGAAISAIAEAGITKGCTSTTFCPEQTVTRGQMATFLTRALDLPDADEHPFDDVPSTHPHADAIAAVAAAGIARGVDEDRFAPDVPVRRDQMASLLAGALELEPNDEQPVRDVGRVSVHAGAVAALAEAAIAKGSGDGTYQPARPIVRGQMASFLHRSFLD